LLWKCSWNANLRNTLHPRTARAAHLLVSAAIIAGLSLSVAGCKTTGNDITGSIRASNAPRSDADWRRSLS
jgi:hypothetical protein